MTISQNFTCAAAIFFRIAIWDALRR